MVYFSALWSRHPEKLLLAVPPGLHRLLLIKQLPFPPNWDSIPVRHQDPGCSHYGGGFRQRLPGPAWPGAQCPGGSPAKETAHFLLLESLGLFTT